MKDLRPAGQAQPKFSLLDQICVLQLEIAKLYKLIRKSCISLNVFGKCFSYAARISGSELSRVISSYLELAQRTPDQSGVEQ
jgi:hypothetical protein